MTTPIILDEYQKAVVDWRAGEAVVAAAAGSGKSTVLVERTAALVREGTDPQRILCLMYNKDAAESFRNKLTYAVGGYVADRVAVYTFHAWGFALLRTWYPKAQMLREVLGAPGGKMRNAAKVVYTAMDKAQVTFWEKDWQAWHEMADFVRDRDYDWEREDDRDALCAVAEERWSFTETQQFELLRFLDEFEALKRDGAYCSIDFADMTFFPCRAIRQWTAAGFPLDHVNALCHTYQHVQVDEAQDTNPARWRIAQHLARYAKSFVVVGDLRQCQPAGTIVDTPRGPTPIEALRDGDTVNAWDRKSQHVSTSEGYAIRTACRPYSGWLFTITTSEGETRCTDTHRWLTRWSQETSTALSAVYLMYREDRGFRIGWCKVIDESNDCFSRHYAQRARLEKADAIWLLKVLPSRADASELESVLACEYGIPLIMFEGRNNEEHYTQERLDRMWQRLGALSREGAKRLLLAAGLSFEHPIWQAGEKMMRSATRATLFETAACNLVPGMMVPVPEGKGTGRRTMRWVEITSVRAESVVDLPVYSMDVDERHSYVADGLCTLNSLYSWQGAEPEEMLRRIDAGATLLTIPVNRRSTAAIVEHGNAICRGRDWHLGGDALPLVSNGQGASVRVILEEEARNEREEARLVIDEIDRRMRQGAQANAFVILSRTNRGLVPFELNLLVREIPCKVLGRAGGVWGSIVGQELLAYLKLCSADLRADIVEVMNKPLRYCTKKDAVAWIQAARLSGEGLRTPVPRGSGPGVERLAADLRMAERLGWKDRCDMVLRWLVSNWDEVSAKKDRAKAKAGEPSKPFEDVAEDDSDLDAVETLYQMLHEVAVMAGSVQEIERQIRTANREAADAAVLLSTVHKYKGQERPTAFVTGLRSGMLPHSKASDFEEERRIFYVASTRAKHELVITTGGSASDFLIEMGIAPDWRKADKVEGGEATSDDYI